MNYVYFAKSLKNGKVYVGRTGKTPSDRVKEHNNSSNKWTKQNGPFDLIYYEIYNCEEDAIIRERFYKTGFGKKIKKAITKTLE